MVATADDNGAGSSIDKRGIAAAHRHAIGERADFSRKEKDVDAALSAAQGGVNLAKPPTRLGTPGDGASVNESARRLRPGSGFVSRALGIYAQDLVQVAPH